MQRTMQDILDGIGDDLLSEFDEITRYAHSAYRKYDASVLIEHDVRAQAACTYSHMLSEAERRFLDNERIRPFDIRGLKVWLFEDADVVVRFKKMDEDGRSRNYPTKQAKDFDAQLELPGLPSAPIRISAGYLLDVTGVDFVRSQISRPAGRGIEWCAAIVPAEQRREGQRIWEDVTRQRRFG